MKTKSNRGGLSFLQQGTSVPGTDNITHENIKCYNCNKMGHYRGQCSHANSKNDKTETGVSALQISKLSISDNKYEVMFAQLDELVNIPKSWVLLDTQSTVSVFNNPGLLENIRKVNKKLILVTNGGRHESNMVGDF